MSNKRGYCRQLPKYVRIQDFCRSYGKNHQFPRSGMRNFLHGLVTWKAMQRSRGNILRTGEQNNSTATQKSQHHPCLDDHQFKEEEMGSVGELSKVCSQIVLKCLFLTLFGRPDIFWSVNKFAHAVAKWTEACNRRLARLISYIHHTCEFRQ